MPFEIELHYLQIGECFSDDITLGFNPEQRLAPQLLDVGNNKECLALPIAAFKPESYHQRIVTILDAVSTGINVDWSSGPVCLLLPQIGEINTEVHSQLFSSMCNVVPALATHSRCFLYPYGRSALLLAWRQIESLIVEKKYPEVWVLAVDSDPRLSLPGSVIDEKKQLSFSGGIASECVILARIRASVTGISRSWFSFEARTSHQTGSIAIEAIFRRYKQVKGQPVYQFYAPFNGTDELVEEWANAYHHLSPWVGKQTQVVMTTAMIGELGACSGLYNLLHLYARHKSGEYLYNTLQLEISEQLFRGAALYSWQQ